MQAPGSCRRPLVRAAVAGGPPCSRASTKALHRAVDWALRFDSGEDVGVDAPRPKLALIGVEAILDGRQPRGLTLAEMLGNGPLAWNVQRETWGFSD
jgi:hypothetical protein